MELVNVQNKVESFLARCIALSLLVSMAAPYSSALNSVLRQDTWVTDGVVLAIAATPTMTYIGGNFTWVMPITGSGVPINITTAQPSGPFPKVNGTIRICVSDGSDGWYIGGDFTAVNSVARNRIAHILSDGTLDTAWNPNASARVSAMALSDATLYVGGYFTTIGGQTRRYAAAINTSSGLVTDWNPNADSVVYSLAVFGTTVYAGGFFTNIGGKTRNYVAALDTATGLATAWNPNANGGSGAYVLSGNTLYIGGSFSMIGGQPRNNIAALDVTTGLATDWNPNANGSVGRFALLGTTLYVGGSFSTIGGQPRNNIAALDTTLNTNNATPWAPNADGGVGQLVLSGTTLYVAGTFTTIAGQPRSCIAALDTVTGLATSWNPHANSGVETLALAGSTLYAGGNFTSICSLPRNHIAAIDPGTGAATSWDPNANAAVHALAVSGTTVYAGGDFTSMGELTRNRIASLDAETGLVGSWNPNANARVRALAVSGATVYVGGDFTSIGGLTRNRIAAFDSGSGLVTTWNPNANLEVFTLAVQGTPVYAAGTFTTLGGQSRNKIAALDVATGLATDWNPNSGAVVTLGVSKDGATVYAGGIFSSIGGQSRNNIAAIDAATGLASTWNPNASNKVNALVVTDSTVYAGGYFTTIGGQTRNLAAAIDITTGFATDWDPNVSGSTPYVQALAVSGTRVYLGGNFSAIGGLARPYFAELIPPTSPSNPGVTAIGVDTITWTWQDNSSDETGFGMYVDPGFALPTTLRTTTAPDVTAWQQDALSPNTQYAFQVAAVKGAEELGRSGVRTAYTLIESISGLDFSNVTTNAVSVFAANTPTNLATGNSGLYFHNLSTDTTSGWQQDNTPWTSVGLSPNTEYTFSGKSRNGASVEAESFLASKYSLAALPATPIVSVPSLHSIGVDALDVEIGSGDGNPLYTVYAIQVSPDVNGNAWVQADGTVDASPVFRMAASWDTRRVSGLTKDTEYTFSVVARNGENLDTAAGPGAKASTYPNVTPSTPTVNLPEIQSDTANLISAISVASYDPDGDPVKYEFDWYVKHSGEADFVLFRDGIAEAAVMSQINNTDTEPGDTWFCVVTPHDMEEAGIPVQTSDCTIVLGGVVPSFISFGLTPLEVTLGESALMLGQIFPTPTGSGTVTFESTSPSGSSSATYPEGTVFSGGAYVKTFYPNEATEGRSPWSVRATWPGDATYQSATSTPVSLTVLKAQPELILSPSYSSALLNLAGAEDFEVAASLSVPGFPAELQSLLAGRTVRLSVQTPDGQTPWAPLEAVTDAAGVAHFDKAAFDAAGVTFTEAGVWRFRTAFDGDANLRSAVTDDFSTTTARLTIKEGAGYVILALGRLDAFAEGHAEHGQTTDYIYSVLRGRGFVDDDIQYLREFLPGEIDRGFPVDGPTTAASLQFAIETWAAGKMLASPAPLYVVLVDHGNPGIFYTDIVSTGPVEFITADDLNGWLGVLESALGQTKTDRHCEQSEAISAMDVSQIASSQAPRNDGISDDKSTAAEQDITVVYGACYSGSFIPVLSGPGRVIITSSVANEIAYRGVINDDTGLRDGDFFLTEFFRNAGEGRTVKEAFELACIKTSEYTATRTGSNAIVPQHPLLDDNADGVGTTGYLSPTPGLDGALAAVMDLGLGANAGNGVGWFTAQPPVTLSPGGTLTTGLWAEATGRAPVPGDTAWVEIKTPAYNDGTVATAGYEAFQRVAALVGPIACTATPEDLGGGHLQGLLLPARRPDRSSRRLSRHQHLRQPDRQPAARSGGSAVSRQRRHRKRHALPRLDGKRGPERGRGHLPRRGE